MFGDEEGEGCEEGGRRKEEGEMFIPEEDSEEFSEEGGRIEDVECGMWNVE